MSLDSAVSSIATALRLRKGDKTRAAILDAALELASRDGLEGLTLGVLADRLDMSKSGVFAHFGSREELQLAVLDEYARRFVAEVLAPAVRSPRGLPRLEKILARWLARLAREITHGCIMIGGSIEYDDRPGPLRDAMVAVIAGWKRELLTGIEQAVAAGHLRRGIDAEQMVFEIYGLMLALHQDARLLNSRHSLKRARAGLARLLDAARCRSRGARRSAASVSSATRSVQSGARSGPAPTRRPA
jgi:AcrR family transcriptional regulator